MQRTSKLIHMEVALVLLLASCGGEGSDDQTASIHCTETKETPSVELTMADGSAAVSCHADGSGGDEVETLEGVIRATGPGEFVLDTCHPDADCSPPMPSSS